MDTPAAAAKQRQGAPRQSPARAKFQNPEWPILGPGFEQRAQPGQKRFRQGPHRPAAGRWRHCYKRLTTQGRDHLFPRPRQPRQIKRQPRLFRQNGTPDRLGRWQGLVFDDVPALSSQFSSTGQRQNAPQRGAVVAGRCGIVAQRRQRQGGHMGFQQQRGLAQRRGLILAPDCGHDRRNIKPCWGVDQRKARYRIKPEGKAFQLLTARARHALEPDILNPCHHHASSITQRQAGGEKPCAAPARGDFGRGDGGSIAPGTKPADAHGNNGLISAEALAQHQGENPLQGAIQQRGMQHKAVMRRRGFRQAQPGACCPGGAIYVHMLKALKGRAVIKAVARGKGDHLSAWHLP